MSCPLSSDTVSQKPQGVVLGILVTLVYAILIILLPFLAVDPCLDIPLYSLFIPVLMGILRVCSV